MIIVIYTDSEERAREVLELAKDVGITAEVLDSVVVLNAEEEKLLALLLDLSEKKIKEYRYLILEEDKNLNAHLLLRLAPKTLSLEELVDKLIHKMLDKIMYDTKIVFHPIIDLKTGNVYACEALCRPPIRIIDLLSIGKSTAFYTEEFCKSNAVKLAKERLRKDLKLFLNFHPRFLGDPIKDFGEFISTLLSYGFETSRVVVEITEYEKLNINAIKGFIKFLKEEKVQVALDDVGSGYSGLFYISELKPDYIKVDIELIRDIHKNPYKQVIVKHLIDMAKEDGIKVICEGIEKEEELYWIKEAGADYAQGFLFGKPEEFPDIESIGKITRELLSIINP